MKRLFMLGFPSSLEMSIRSVGMVLMTFIVSTFGTLVVAAFGVGSKILSFAIIPAMGFGMASATLVGNNIGAKQYKRVKAITKTALKIAFISLTAFGLVVFPTAEAIAAFFTPNDAELIAMAADFIRAIAFMFGLIGIQMVVIASIRAAGNSTTAMLLALIQTFFIFMIAYVFGVIMKMGEWGLWLSYPAANIIAAGITLLYYRKKDWLQKQLV